MRLLTKILLGLLAVVIIGQFLPYTFISIQGNSMEPTIPDGSVQIIYETNNVDVGDIIVFESQESDGQLIIHRISGSTEDGFITIGDNNERTDQRTGEPPVTKDNIRGEAVVISDQPIYIPYIGSLSEFVRINMIESILLVLGAGGLNLLYSEFIHNKKQMGVLTQNDIVFPIFIAVFLGLTVVILIGATTISAPITYTTSESVAQQQYVVQVSDQSPRETLSLEVRDELGVELYTSSYDVIDTNRTEDTIELTVAVPPQDEPGTINGTIRVYRFPPILPESWLQSLLLISPLLPAVISSASVLVPIYGLYLIVGTPYERVRKPRHPIAKKIYKRL